MKEKRRGFSVPVEGQQTAKRTTNIDEGIPTPSLHVWVSQCGFAMSRIPYIFFSCSFFPFFLLLEQKVLMEAPAAPADGSTGTHAIQQNILKAFSMNLHPNLF